MAETQYTHSTTGASQFVGDAGLAVVAEVRTTDHGIVKTQATYIVWFTTTDGTGSLSAATYSDAYAIGLALATYGMTAGERVKWDIQRGLAPTLVGLTASASTVRA
jgi:hypothetical protein